MSERTHAPRSGGRVKDQRGTVPARDADTQPGAAQRRAGQSGAGQSSDARGARHFDGAEDGRSDTRRSGIRGSAGEPASRGSGREGSLPRARARDNADDVRGDQRRSGSDLARGKGRRPEPMVGKSRAEAGAPRRRDTGSIAPRKRDTGLVEGRKRDTGAVEAGKRDTGAVEGRKRDLGVLAERGLGKGARSGRLRDNRDSRGGRPVLDAPVDGTAALKPIEVEVAAPEPLRVTGPVRTTGEVVTPMLRVAPPAPVSAPRAPFVASVIGVVIVGVLGILMINTKTNENSFRIADLQKQGAALDNQRQDLDNQLVAVSNIGNLGAAARRLGLVQADKPAMITLPDGKIIGVLTPANGKPAVTAEDGATPAGGKASTGPSAGQAAPATGQPAGASNGAQGTGTAGNGTAGNGTTADGSQMTGTSSATGTGQ